MRRGFLNLNFGFGAIQQSSRSARIPQSSRSMRFQHRGKLIAFAAFALSFCIAAQSLAQSQGAPISAIADDTTIDFGSPVFLFSDAASRIMGIDAANSFSSAEIARFARSAGGSYLDTGAWLYGIGANIPAAGEGEVLFVQTSSALRGGMPQPAGNFLAIAHRDGFVSVYSAQGFLPPSGQRATLIAKGDFAGSVSGVHGLENAHYRLRVYDGTSKLWANPALFIQGLDDTASPKIRQIALLGGDQIFIAENKKNAMQELPQADYLICASIIDTAFRKESISGLFRIKVVLDGRVVADRKLDSARVTEHGLGFLDVDAPSSNAMDDQGRLLLGKQFLPSGKHSLELYAYDFSGNEASFTWKFIVR